MAKLRIKKIEIAATVSDSEKIIRLLQRRGVVELSEPEELLNFSSENRSEEISEIESRYRTAESAERILSKYVKKSGGLLSSLNERISLTDKQYDEMVGEADNIYSVAQRVTEIDKRITDNNVSEVRFQTLIDSLRPWENLDVPLDFKGTKKVAVIIGTFFAEYDREYVLSSIAAELPDIESVDAEIISSAPDQTCAVVYCMTADRSAVEQVMRNTGFVRISEPVHDTAKGRIAKLTEDIENLRKDSLSAEDELRSLGDNYEKIKFFKDYCLIEKDKNAAFQKIIHSERIFVLSGYIPEIRSEKLKKDIEEKYDAAVIISEPDEDDDIPVVLKNNGFAAPVEPITEMYSLPGKKDIDPTPIMAFFYYLFFGMMLSDAGYGLIIAIATGIVLLKFKMEERMRNTVKMYFYCGLSTVFWGAMYGSWFGDMPNIIGSNFFGTDKFESVAIWIDPLEELMTLLVYCFIFGLVHLFVGVGIKMYTLWRNGHKLDALCESIPTYVLILGFCPIFFGLFTEVPEWMNTVGTPVLIVGAILVVATAGRNSKSIVGKIGGGLYGLYNLVSGYLGDVLSYARLLALGLSTGVIAQVVNMLCTLPSNKVLQVIMLIVVGAIGHALNLAINLIGAYVHTNRLQYVEFFGKFYEGGGRAMHPLKINTKYYKFKEEN